MLTSMDVQSFRLYSPVSRQVQEIKGCFKQQMQPVELLSFVIAMTLGNSSVIFPSRKV